MSVLVGMLSFVSEYVNASLGMGYGTTLTPILLLLGYPPDVIVPTVLLTGFITGLVSGGSHHTFGNISLRRGSPDRRIIALLAITGTIGSASAVVVSSSLSNQAVRAYISVMVIVMGVLVFVFRNHRIRFSYPRIFAIGAVAAFNKGISGGGYGPLVVSGQILSGHGVRNAVGIACFTEGVICAIGFAVYLALNGGIGWLQGHWAFYVPVVVGAVLAAPLASWTTRMIVRTVDLRIVVAVLTCLLGSWTLWKTFA